MTWLTESKDGCVLSVWASPKASRSEIVGLVGEPPRLKIKIAAPPVDGAANEELLRFLRKKLAIPASQLSLLRGETSKFKDVAVSGLSRSVVLERLRFFSTPNSKGLRRERRS